MSVLKVIEIMSDSTKSWEDATVKGVAKAHKTLKGIKSAFVQSQSVTVGKDGKVASYRVTLKISFEIL
jgi:flavin-binding protein dodecin